MTDTEATSSSNEELISQFLILKDTLIKNGVDMNIIKGTPLRKKTKAEYNAYFREYMKDRYSTDPDYKAKVKERSRKAKKKKNKWLGIQKHPKSPSKKLIAEKYPLEKIDGRGKLKSLIIIFKQKGLKIISHI